MRTESFNMNLFNDSNNKNDFASNISLYARTNGYGLLAKEKHWTLFEKDEIKVHIKFVETNGKKQIEFTTPLFEDISLSLAILIRPICGEKFIRDIAKKDSIGRFGDKILIIRYINFKEEIAMHRVIERNINSILSKAKRLQEEISSLLDYVMFIKLN